MKITYFIHKFDWILIISAIFLTSIGLLAIFSYSLAQNNFLNFQKQIIFLIIGIILMFAFSFFDWRQLRANPYLILFIYILSISGLIGLFFFAPEIRGTRSWYKIGPIYFDPIESVKIALILLLAKFFSQRHIEMYDIRHIILSGVYTAIPVLLIFLQPNMGSAVILIAVWFGILLVSGIKLKHFFILCLVFLLIFMLGWTFVFKDYQKARILSFISPSEHYLGVGWHQAQSKIAIGSGGLWGKDIGEGTQVQGGFLPEPHTDFIFATIAEEMGFVGVVILLLPFSVLLWRISKIAFGAKNNFIRLFASGFMILLATQAFINIGMNLGILPIIGISLPLVSYGGSGLMLTYIGLGILQGMRFH